MWGGAAGEGVGWGGVWEGVGCRDENKESLIITVDGPMTVTGRGNAASHLSY